MYHTRRQGKLLRYAFLFTVVMVVSMMLNAPKSAWAESGDIQLLVQIQDLYFADANGIESATGSNICAALVLEPFDLPTIGTTACVPRTEQNVSKLCDALKKAIIKQAEAIYTSLGHTVQFAKEEVAVRGCPQ